MSELSLFFRRLHTMVESGISLQDSLSYLEQGEANPDFHLVIGDVLESVLSGFPLSQGLRKSPEVFSRLTIELVATGENTGALVQTFEHLATLYERGLDRRHRIRAALAYPMCLLVVMILVIGLFVVFVAPGDSGIFAALGGNIPWPSQVLISLSSFVTNPILLLIIGATLSGAVMVLKRAYRENDEFRLKVDRCLLQIPVLGSFLARLESAKTLEVLASSLRVGMNMVGALQNAIRVATNHEFRDSLKRVLEGVVQGESLGKTMENKTVIPRLATSMIEVGETTGDLDGLLLRAAHILDEDCNDALARLVSLAEPLLLALGGAAAGFVAIATLLPVIRMVATF